MTPNDIEVLLHCHTSPMPHPRYESPAVKQALNKFLAEDLIADADGSHMVFTTTEKGAFHIKQLCALPLPVQQWTTPPIDITNNE